MTRIVLPQALRNVIPAQIGQFISLFKDTTLAGLALGILDLLAAGQAITQQDPYRGQGLIIETLCSLHSCSGLDRSPCPVRVSASKEGLG